MHAPSDPAWVAKQLFEKQQALEAVQCELKEQAEKLKMLLDLANQEEEEEPEYNIESKWLEEINILHSNIEKMNKEASKAVDVERLEKSFESNLAFLREQIKSEIGAKA